MKFFQLKFIILNSALVEEMLEGTAQKEMIFVLGRFIGALKAKHFRFALLSILINSLEKLKGLNFFLLPYIRATQYTGDQIGLVLCQDLGSAVNAITKFMVGNKLSNKVGLKGTLAQSIKEHRGIFSFLSTLCSTHPHLTSRYLNLLIFSKTKFSKLLKDYFSKFDETYATEVETLIPYFLPKRRILLGIIVSGIVLIIFYTLIFLSMLIINAKGSSLAWFIYSLFQ